MNKAVRLVLVKMYVNFNLMFRLSNIWYYIFCAHIRIDGTFFCFFFFVVEIMDNFEPNKLLVAHECDSRQQARVKHIILPNQNVTVPVVAIVAARFHEMWCTQLSILAMIVSIADFMKTVLMLIHFFFNQKNQSKMRFCCLSFGARMVYCLRRRRTCSQIIE